MKTFTFNSRFLLLLFFSIISVSVTAQSPCDVCTAPWGPVQKITLTSQTITSKAPFCTYTFVYEYRERNCGGSIEIDLISLNTTSENSSPFCDLNSYTDCYNTRRSGIRSLVNLLGIPVTFSQEKSCYALFEVDPPQAFLDCFLSPGETVDTWYAFVECDANSCCSITYTPNGNGTVDYTYNNSTPCSPAAAPVLPASLTWECKGVFYTFPVNQSQPVNCENTCSFGSGTIFKQAEQTEIDITKENSFSLYPNPTNGDITLDYTVFEMDQLEIVVLNVQGQEVYNDLIQISNGSESITLNTDEWSSGIYTMRIQGNGQLLESQRIQVVE